MPKTSVAFVSKSIEYVDVDRDVVLKHVRKYNKGIITLPFTKRLAGNLFLSGYYQDIFLEKTFKQWREDTVNLVNNNIDIAVQSCSDFMTRLVIAGIEPEEADEYFDMYFDSLFEDWDDKEPEEKREIHDRIISINYTRMVFSLLNDSAIQTVYINAREAGEKILNALYYKLKTNKDLFYNTYVIKDFCSRGLEDFDIVFEEMKDKNPKTIGLSIVSGISMHSGLVLLTPRVTKLYVSFYDKNSGEAFIEDALKIYKKTGSPTIGDAELAMMFGVAKSKDGILVSIKNLLKAMVRMPKKGSYKQKTITESGKPSYNYSQPKTKTNEVKQEEEPVIDINFREEISKKIIKDNDGLIESVFDLFEEKTFFGMFLGINTIKISDNTREYMSFLAIPQDEQTDELLGSCGTYGVESGKVAFNPSNIPDSTDQIKQIAMAHEFGHAFFYGVLRFEHQRLFYTSPAVSELIKSKYQFLRSCVRFVNGFGAYSNQDVTDELAMKSQESKNVEEEVAQEERKYVSLYAMINDVEHFAEVFAYYFVAPDVLKKNEIDAYNAFEEFFKKYSKRGILS